MERARAWWAAAVLAALAAAGPARAVPVFDNFGPGDSYAVGVGATIGGDASQVGRVDAAMAFTPPADALLITIDLAVGLVLGASELDVWLMSDSGGAPDAIIEAFHLSGAMGDFGDWNPPLHIESLLQPVLSGGVQYWLAASAGSGNTWAAWNLNDIGDVGPFASGYGGPWVTGSGDRSAFRINEPAPIPVEIPEPATALLAGAGIVGLALAGRRVQVHTQTVGRSVPRS